MTIKIDAPPGAYVKWMSRAEPCGVRIIRESDWRRIMAVVRAADGMHPSVCVCCVCEALNALRKHTEKRK